MTASRLRLLFRTAALFNFGAALLFLPQLGIARSLGLEPVPAGTIFEYVGLSAVVLFGIGYWMAASAPERNRGIIQLGLAGKLIVVGLAVCFFVKGDANLRLVGVISGDLVYCAPFARYLMSTRRVAGRFKASP